MIYARVKGIKKTRFRKSEMKTRNKFRKSEMKNLPKQVEFGRLSNKICAGVN